MKRFLITLFCFCVFTFLTIGCVGEKNAVNAATSLAVFSERDMEVGYDEEGATHIILGEQTTTSGRGGVVVEGEVVTISEEGTYILSGSLAQGQIVVDGAKTAKIQIVLDDVSLSNESTAPIYIKEADKVFITMAEGSENTFSVTGTFQNSGESNVDAVIFSKADLTLNGNGVLKIEGKEGNGISSKDDLIVTGGTYEISAGGHGLEGKDAVRIADGIFEITVGKDGIHCENTEDLTLGNVYLAGGDFEIEAQQDGISGGSSLEIQDGTFYLLTGGGWENSLTTVTEEILPNRENGRPWENGMTPSVDESQEETADILESAASTKGLKATGDIIVNGGIFMIDSADDGIHSNGNIMIGGGEFLVKTGDDGIHADENVTMGGGSIAIEESYEGVEGKQVTISAGEIKIVATDDGVNATSGTTERVPGGSGQENVSIEIIDGNLTVIAGGDGLDSNGDILVSGGETYVFARQEGADSALDYDGEATITGGVFVAVGGGMAQNFGDTSTQGAILAKLSQSQEGEVVLAQKDGSILAKFSPTEGYQSVLISTPEIKIGQGYTLLTGEETQEIVMTALIYGVGEQMGRENGQQGMGERPKRPGNFEEVNEEQEK